MRILLVDQFSELGGAQRCLLEAAEGFAERGWEITAAIPEGPLAGRLEGLGASIVSISCGPFQSVRKNASDAARFAAQFFSQARAIARTKADVVYVNGPRVLPAAVWGRAGRPVVFHSHSVVTQQAAAKLAGTALRWSNSNVIASSSFVAAWLSPYLRADHCQVIYNGVRNLGRAPHTRTRFRRIGMLGRIAPEKGQLDFVRAARIAAAANPDLTFQVTGGPVFGNQNYVDQVQSEADPVVRFTAWTEDVGRFFDDIDLLVVPSESVDANPRVIPEAYAAGVPVIAYESGGIAELLVDGKTGLLVKEHSPGALAAAILNAVRDPEALNQYARNGYERWMQHYALSRFQSKVCGVLERVHTVPASARA